ncbi:N-acetyltransferase [Massilia sp.]|uniref:GNAT family N-acetyltransferase n=1 Tax=Massilia sp. TaxID=1882437 RepID=UPI00289F6D7D|nr:N-acetyltransferase [Massilia sp.]
MRADRIVRYAPLGGALSGSGSVRRAWRDDLAALVAIENASFPGDRLDRRRFRYLLAHAHGVILVDTAPDASLRGYVLLLFRSNSPIARVYSIATHPHYLGQGVAARLLQAAEQLALDHGHSRQRLEIRVDNTPSRTLFGRHGYREFGRHTAYYHDGMDAVRLEKPLQR